MVNSLPEDVTNKNLLLEKELESLKKRYDAEVKSNLNKYRRVIDATSEGFLELDLQSRIVDYNSTIVELTGKSSQSLLHSPVENLYDKSTVFVHFANKDHLSFEAELHIEGQETVSLLFKRSILRDKDGQPNGYLVFLTELTELRKTQENLKQAESKYSNIYQNAAQGMYQCTLEGNLLRANPAFARLFGYAETTLLLSHVSNIITLYKDPNNRLQLIADLKKHLVVINYEVEMQDRDGKSVWALINARLTDNTNGPPLIDGILIDNTKKRLAEDQLRKSRERFRYLANHDSLTGLFNTRYLYKSLDKLISESNETNRPFSLVFLDMDNFKHIVDTYGHLNGSQALKEVAETFKEVLIEPSYGVAYGGDEFVLVFPQTNTDMALEHVDTIRQLMKATTYLTNKGLEVYMSASFGVATYPDDAIDSVGLLALADEAMFHVKSSGKDAVGVPSDIEEL